MKRIEKRELTWWQKYTLTLNEALEYFGIGYKKLKMFVQEHSDEDFAFWGMETKFWSSESSQKNYGQSDERNLICRNYHFSSSKRYMRVIV